MIIVRGKVLDHNHEWLYLYEYWVYTHILWSVHEAWSHVLNPPMKYGVACENGYVIDEKRHCIWQMGTRPKQM